MSDILLLAANAALRHALAEQLRPEAGWAVTAAADVAAALASLREKTPLAVLAEAALLARAEDAQRLAAQSEALTPPPFLCVIGEGGEAVAGLATEIFPLPLRLGHVLARLQFYQQAQQRRDVTYDLGRWRFAPRARQVTADAVTVRLTDKESALLELLCQTREPVHRDELLATLWGYDGSIDTHTLETHIYRLRQRLPEGQELFLVKNGAYRINPAWGG